MDTVPPNKVCLYGSMNWSLAQAQQQSSLGLSQSFTPMRGHKARQMIGFHFSVPKRPVSGIVVTLAKRPHFKEFNHYACYQVVEVGNLN